MLWCPVTLRNGFIGRNGAASQAAGGNEGQWKDFLRREGATGEHAEALENNWLRAKGATGGTNFDLWNQYLSTKGFNTGSIADRQAAFFIGGTQA